MAWTAPMTASAHATFTAAQFNQHIRDNLLETCVAKASNDSRYFVATGTNAIAERRSSQHTIERSETTTSTSYTDLRTTGPSVYIGTGTSAIVWIGANIAQGTADAYAGASIEVSGASTVSASDDWQISIDGQTSGDATRRCAAHRFTGLTSGNNTFKMKYKVSAGTGTFSRREMLVMAF